MKTTCKESLQNAIDAFLDATCALTPRWFNKPKFHLLLHLLAHICRFGPAILFATEGFKSLNAVIRARSIHSNHRAPSRDIAVSMAHHNRIRHILSGGYLCKVRIVAEQDDNALSDQIRPESSPWLHAMSVSDIDSIEWRSGSTSIGNMLSLNRFATDILGLFSPDACIHEGDIGMLRCCYPKPLVISVALLFLGLCRKLSSQAFHWGTTLSAKAGVQPPPCSDRLRSRFCTAESVFLQNGDWCKTGNHIIWSQTLFPASAPDHTLSQHPEPRSAIGRVCEILQLADTVSAQYGKADYALIQHYEVRRTHAHYNMPILIPLRVHTLVPVAVRILDSFSILETA